LTLNPTTASIPAEGGTAQTIVTTSAYLWTPDRTSNPAGQTYYVQIRNYNQSYPTPVAYTLTATLP